MHHLVEALYFGDDDTSATIYPAIERVQAGWHVRISSDGVHAQPLEARPARMPPPAEHDDAGWESALRDTLDAAVIERCQGPAPIAIALSGGLDSTAVAALAARHLAKDGRRLYAFTLRASGVARDVPGRFSDETALASSLASAYPNIVHRIVPHPVRPDLLGEVEKLMRVSGEPSLSPINWANAAALREAVAELGPATLLGGGVGNLTISDTGEDLLNEMLAKGRVAEWFALSRALRNRGKTALHILNLSFAEFLPRRVYRALLAAFGRSSGQFAGAVPVRPDLARAIGLAAAIDANSNKAHLPPLARRRAILRRRDRGRGYYAIRRVFGIDQADPTYDADVVELGLAIPNSQNLRPHEDRSLIRRAMRGLVPDAIRLELRRGHQLSDWQDKIAADLPALKAELAALEACAPARDMLDLARLREMLETPVEKWGPGGHSHAVYGSDLMRGLAMGRFLRLHEAGEI
jgi:asparagine synthase (glutamine-hydrolysing)